MKLHSNFSIIFPGSRGPSPSGGSPLPLFSFFSSSSFPFFVVHRSWQMWSDKRPFASCGPFPTRVISFAFLDRPCLRTIGWFPTWLEKWEVRIAPRMVKNESDRWEWCVENEMAMITRFARGGCLRDLISIDDDDLFLKYLYWGILACRNCTFI